MIKLNLIYLKKCILTDIITLNSNGLKIMKGTEIQIIIVNVNDLEVVKDMEM